MPTTPAFHLFQLAFSKSETEETGQKAGWNLQLQRRCLLHKIWRNHGHLHGRRWVSQMFNIIEYLWINLLGKLCEMVVWGRWLRPKSLPGLENRYFSLFNCLNATIFLTLRFYASVYHNLIIHNLPIPAISNFCIFLPQFCQGWLLISALSGLFTQLLSRLII